MLIRAFQQGFTLVELMVAVVIVGILLAAGVPSFMNWIQSAQVRTAAESIQNGLQLARVEAVRRNQLVRFTLTDATGLTAWSVGCVTAIADNDGDGQPDCPATIQSRAANEGGANARVGISVTSPVDYTVAVSAGDGLPAGVTFNGLGRMPAANIAGDIKRIDISNAVDATARTLSIAITTGGQVRMCNPGLDKTDSQGCPK